MNQKNEIYPAFQRVRHNFKARHLRLQSREQLSPNFLRLTLAGELSDFVSEGFDDHFKLILPQPGMEKPNLPQLVEGKPVFAEPRPTMRDYTPLAWSVNTLTIDFALHEQGPATEWARTAALGSWVGIAGPRGSLVISKDFPNYWLFADSTGFPAVERALRRLPSAAVITVRLSVPESDRRVLSSQAPLDLKWVESLVSSAEIQQLPDQPCFIWAAGESLEMKKLRDVLLAKGVSSKQMRIASYWKLGSDSHHEELEMGQVS